MEGNHLINLPLEMLMNIISFLPLKDQRILRLVSKEFKELLDNKLQNCTLKITEKNIVAIKERLSQKNIDKLNFKHLEFEDIASIMDVRTVLEAVGEVVETLTMESSPAFESAKGNLKNLKCLKLHFNTDTYHNPNNIDVGEFPCLEQLHLKNHYFTTADVIKQILSQLVKNSNLKLKSLYVCFEVDIEPQLLNLMMMSTDTLEYLRIDFKLEILETINVLIWKKVFQRLVNLKTLIMNYEYLIDFLEMILTNLPEETQLEHIAFNTCYFNDELLQFIANKWKNTLQYVKIENNCWISEEGVKEFNKLTKLRSLHITDCQKVKSVVLLNGPATKHNPVIKELNLCCLCSFDELCFSTIASSFTNLCVLKLNSLSAVTNNSLAQIFRYQTQLRILAIESCINITEDGLIGFGDIPYSIRRLRGLEELSLQYCDNLTDRTLNEALHFPELRTLDLRKTRKFTTKGIVELVKNCPSLESFGLSVKINKSTLIVIGKGLKRLKKLIFGLRRIYFLANEFNRIKKGPEPLFTNCVLKFDDISRLRLLKK